MQRRLVFNAAASSIGHWNRIGVRAFLQELTRICKSRQNLLAPCSQHIGALAIIAIGGAVRSPCDSSLPSLQVGAYRIPSPKIARRKDAAYPSAGNQNCLLLASRGVDPASIRRFMSRSPAPAMDPTANGTGRCQTSCPCRSARSAAPNSPIGAQICAGRISAGPGLCQEQGLQGSCTPDKGPQAAV